MAIPKTLHHWKYSKKRKKQNNTKTEIKPSEGQVFTISLPVVH